MLSKRSRPRRSSSCAKKALQEEGEEVLRPDLDQLFQDHPGMTEAMAASIQSKIAFGERAGEKVRRENGDLLYELKTPWSDGTTAILLSPEELSEKIAALVPPPDSHLTRYSEKGQKS